MVTWSEPVWLTLDSTDHTPVRSRAAYFLIRPKLNTTSAADIGVPSLNLTPLRMVNVLDLLPAAHVQEAASMGVVLPFCSGLTYTSGSHTNPTARSRDAPRTGGTRPG